MGLLLVYNGDGFHCILEETYVENRYFRLCKLESDSIRLVCTPTSRRSSSAEKQLRSAKSASDATMVLRKSSSSEDIKCNTK